MSPTATGAMSQLSSVARLPDEVRRAWTDLIQPTDPAVPFDPRSVAGLPDPTQRWLRHAIAPGTPLRQSIEVKQHGEIRLGAWRRFEAAQALAPLHGYIWAVTAHLFGMP